MIQCSKTKRMGAHFFVIKTNSAILIVLDFEFRLFGIVSDFGFRVSDFSTCCDEVLGTVNKI